MINKIVVSNYGKTDKALNDLALLLQEHCGYNIKVITEGLEILAYLNDENYGFFIKPSSSTFKIQLWNQGKANADSYFFVDRYYRVNNSYSESEQILYSFNYVKTEEGVAWGLSNIDKQSIFACSTKALDIISEEETTMHMIQVIGSTSTSSNSGLLTLHKTTENTIVDSAPASNKNYIKYANNLDNGIVMTPIYYTGHNANSVVMAKGVYESVVFPPITNTIEFELNGAEYVSADVLTWYSNIGNPEKKPRFIFKTT